MRAATGKHDRADPLPKGSLRENVLWLTTLQFLNYLLPLVTVPYLIRVLGPKDYGVLSFSVTISQYLVVFTDYGFNLSATRQIALVRDNRRKLEETISAVLAVKIGLLLLSTSFLLLFVAFDSKYHAYAIVLIVAFLNVIGSVAFPIWLFQGLQDMRLVTILTAIGRLICTAALFLTVHSSRDVAEATLWTVSGFPIAGFIGWFVIRKRYRLQLHKPSMHSIKEAIQSGFHVFVSSLMSNALVNGSVLVMGFAAPLSVVGSYAAMEKIAKAGAMGFAPLTQALYPRAAEHFAQDHRHGKSFVLRTGALVLLLAAIASLAMAFGAKWILAIICGHSFEQYVWLVRIFAVWLFLGVLNNILGIQYLLGSGRYRAYSTCFTLSTLATFAMLITLVPQQPFWGAALSVTLGEGILTALMTAAILIRSQNSHYSLNQKSTSGPH